MHGFGWRDRRRGSRIGLVLSGDSRRGLISRTMTGNAVLLGVLLFLLPTSQGYSYGARYYEDLPWAQYPYRGHLQRSNAGYDEYDDAYHPGYGYHGRRQSNIRPACREGQIYHGGQCVQLQSGCPEGFTVVDNKCTDSGGVTAVHV
uniref:Uncharacterized protein n=1 Tax=Timema bartmani TaxID=61472 RepID=A0A7R9F315_9NEOP|nr:unnamed protein product [Timema bartmani]